MQKLYTLILLLLPFFTIAQSFDVGLAGDMKPRNIGPGGMSGRVTAIDVVHDNPRIMFVGTASGGLWKSTSGGIDWAPVFDDQPTASIGAVAIDQQNPSVIWVGTGEGNPRNSLNGGYGLYRSLDGGKSWKCMGLEETRHIHRVIVHPRNPDIVYVGAIGSPWGEHPQRGVYRTTDGGKSWEKILFVNDRTGVADMVMDPSNPNKLIVAMWEHKREPWFFKSGGPGSGLYVTHDGGDTWEQRGEDEGLPKGELGRIGLAIARSNPDVVYALVEAKKNGLYKSQDGGFTWSKVNDKNDIGNRPFYYSDLYVDPENENRVYSIFTYVNVSDDGGHSFEQLMPAYGVSNGVHPDHHAWWIHPMDGNFMIDGNDGGMNITRDRGASWRFIGNLPVGQFYHISVDNDIPYNVYGGMQDNGSWRGPAYVWRAQGIRNSYWQEISFGDGFDVVPDPEDSRYGWSMSQQGYVSRYDWQTGNNYSVRPTHPDPEMMLRFNWNSAINIDPFDSQTLYFGSQFVHKSTDKGLTWELISPDLTTNDPEKQKQSESGGLTMDATGAENYTTILVIEPSPLERGMLWAGTDDGRVHYTRDGGSSWTDVSGNIPGLPDGSWIVQIKASNKRQGEALLVANDYRRYNYNPYAYRTTDYGKTWKRLVDKDDVLSYTLCIVEDPVERNLLFLGTDDGLYVSVDAGTNWAKWTNGFPTTSVKDLVIHPREHDLVIGTFGRAAWVLDDIRPLRAIASNKEIVEDEIALFPAPTAYQAAYRQPAGSRFGGDAMFNGANRPYGARFRYYFAKGKEDEGPSKEEGDEQQKDGAHPDSLYLRLYDGDRLIRTLKKKRPDSSGIYTWRWMMDEAGVQRPRRTPRKQNREPGGVQVKPGTYRAVISYRGMEDNTTIRVETDPRLSIETAAIQEQYTALKELEKYAKLTADAVRQLATSKSTVEDLQKKLKEKDKEAYSEQIEKGKELITKIDSLMAGFIGKLDKRQGITRNPEVSVNQRIGWARSYVGSRPGKLTATERKLMRWAGEQLRANLEGTNAFYRDTWPEYRQAIESLDLSPFEGTKQFSIDQ